MLYLKSAKTKFKAIKKFNVGQDIKEGEIKLLASNGDVLTIDFMEYNISVTDSNNNVYDADEISGLDDIKYVNIEWSEGLSYISLGKIELYQEDAQEYIFTSMPEIKEILELSYNIDDCKYSNGELLEAIEFELLFEDKYGNDKIFKLI